MRNRRFTFSLPLLCAVLLSACGNSPAQPEANTPQQAEAILAVSPAPEPAAEEEAEIIPTGIEEETKMKLLIGETEVAVQWEANESVAALRELASDDTLTISMSMYGGFEQVGLIGTSLPRNDVQTVTDPGDIVLYAGNQIVVFYGSNSWAYTRLGKITDLTLSELRELLGNGDTSLTISCR